MKGLWFRVQGSEFQGFRIRRQSAMVPIVQGLIVTTSALPYGSVGWTKKSSKAKVFNFGIVPKTAKQLQVLLHPRTVPLLYYYCTTTVLLLYYYCNTTVLPLYYYRHTTVLLHYCNIIVLLYYYCTTIVLLLYYYCTTHHCTAPGLRRGRLWRAFK